MNLNLLSDRDAGRTLSETATLTNIIQWVEWADGLRPQQRGSQHEHCVVLRSYAYVTSRRRTTSLRQFWQIRGQKKQEVSFPITVGVPFGPMSTLCWSIH